MFAARIGWNVSAFDISTEAKTKALRLTQEEGVEINCTTISSPDLPFREEAFDAIALIYAHIPKPVRKEYFSRLNQLLKKGRTVIFESFASRHPEYQKKNTGVGGPKTEENAV